MTTPTQAAHALAEELAHHGPDGIARVLDHLWPEALTAISHAANVARRQRAGLVTSAPQRPRRQCAYPKCEGRAKNAGSLCEAHRKNLQRRAAAL